MLFTSYGDDQMGYQTDFQQKNIYLVIEKQLLNLLDKKNTQKIQNYENFINPSSNLSKKSYNGLLDVINRRYLK